jgi:hypothetical protein
MKIINFLFVCLLSMGMVTAQTVPVQVSFKFVNIEEGYDHLCRTQVLIDGQEAAVSAEVLQSKGATVTVQVPKGSHDLRIVNWARYEGTWEEHTVENNYSLDCTYEEFGHSFQKADKIFLVFDLDGQTHVNWGKAPKIKKSKGA